MSKRRERSTRRQRNVRRKNILQNRTLMAGVAVVAIFVAALAYVAITREDVGKKFSDEGHTHLDDEPASYIWNTRPPTSGPHAPNIARWGESNETVPEWFQIHNLEDGGIIFHYNCPEGCPDIVDGLRDIIRDRNLEDYILHPYTNMDTRIAVTAWTRLLALDVLDTELIGQFISQTYGIDHHR